MRRARCGILRPVFAVRALDETESEEQRDAEVVTERFVHGFAQAALSPDPDLAVAALMIARVERRRLDAGPYLDLLDDLGREAAIRVQDAPVIAGQAPHGADSERHARVVALNRYLFHDLHFVGNQTENEDPRDTFLNEVLDRRVGDSVALALLYLEVARRAGLRVHGINVPRRFLLCCPAPGGMPYSRDLIIDPFRGGALLSEEACLRMLHPPDEDEEEPRYGAALLRRATKQQILARMLLDLKRLYVRMRSFPQARDATELLLAVDPSAINELRDRGLLAYHLNDFSAALRDLQAYLELSARAGSGGKTRDEQKVIWEHVKTLRRRVATLN
jgi:regulator of sirC expression with transglutaminase-like and TPR domain